MQNFHSYLSTPEHPIREILKAMTGKNPPKFLKGYSVYGTTDDKWDELQTWAVNNCKPYWLTGIALLESAEDQVLEAVSNGNIPPEPETDEIEVINRQLTRLARIFDNLSSNLRRLKERKDVCLTKTSPPKKSKPKLKKRLTKKSTKKTKKSLPRQRRFPGSSQ